MRQEEHHNCFSHALISEPHISERVRVLRMDADIMKKRLYIGHKTDFIKAKFHKNFSQHVHDVRTSNQ